MSMSRFCLKSFAATILGLSLNVAVAAGPIAFSFDYLDNAGEGFNDPSYGATARSALEYAGSVWSSYLPSSYTGETIHVAAYMDPFASGSTTLASTFLSGGLWRKSSSTAQLADSTFYLSSLANHLVKRDLDAATDEIKIIFNSDKPFYYGTDFDAPTTSYDFVSLAMHEVGHGLGFYSRIDKDSSDGAIGSFLTSSSGFQYPSIYDRFLFDAISGGTRLIDMSDAQRSVAITSGSVYWGGTNGVAANGGIRPEMYAPAVASAGSSLTHFDDSTHFLLDPNLNRGEDVRIDAVTLGVLADIGWSISPVPEPAAYMMLIVGLLGLGFVRERQR